MAYNYEYPYTDPNRGNSDWILNKMKELTNSFEDFVKVNQIKYANPINWNISTQYERNTVVIDANTGDAYLSVKEVPNGVSLTNTEYWTPIFNYSLTIEELRKEITPADEGQSPTATENRVINDLIWLNNKLYKAIENINAGALYIVGDNIVKTTIDEEIKNIITSVSNLDVKIDNIEDTLNAKIGDVIYTDEERTALNVDNKIMGVNNSVLSVENLTTTDKAKLVDVNVSSATNPLAFIRGSETEITGGTYEGSASIGLDVAQSEDNQHDIRITNSNIKAVNFPILFNNADGHGAIISHNYIESENGDAIELNTPNSTFSNINVVNNILSAGASGGTSTGNGFSVGIAKGKDVVVANNNSKYSRIDGYHIEDNSERVLVANNIFNNIQRHGTYLGNLLRSGGVNKPIQLMNNIFNGVKSAGSIGIRTIYDANYNLVHKLICVYNRVSNFVDGIRIAKSKAIEYFMRMDGTYIEDCTNGIITASSIAGIVDMDNISNQYLEMTQSGLVVDGFNVNGIVNDVDKLVSRTYGGSKSIVRHMGFTVKKASSGGRYDINIIPKGAGFFGDICLLFSNDANEGTVIAHIAGSTVNVLAQTFYGSMNCTLAIVNDYINITGVSGAGDVTVKVTMDGYYII